jgi:RNA polymerase sigma factor (sigma-70 family)
MARFRLEAVASLARQMGFTPAPTRLAQLARAEVLCGEVEPERAYPTEFVVYRVTDFRAKTLDGGGLLTGLALRHDLGLLIETVSDQMDLPASEAGEPVLGVQQAAARFNVSTKTIQRWRRKGLCARRFVFEDGKKRVGFLLSSIERFAGQSGGEVSAVATAVSGDETAAMVRHARRLTTLCHCDEAETCRRIARIMKRSPMAVRHTLLHHDQCHPEAAVLPWAAAVATKKQRRRVVRGIEAGRPIRWLARKVKLPRATVARIVINREAKRLTKQRAVFIDDPLLRGPEALGQIRDLLSAGDLAAPAEAPLADRRRQGAGDVAALCAARLLSAAQERAWFLKFNYHRRRFALARRAFDPMLARRRDLMALRRELDAAAAARNYLVQANMRLVVNIARRHLRPDLDLMELVSDGTLVLMRAIDGFNVGRGNKFSTYATLALMKGFARSVPQSVAKRLTGDAARLAETPANGPVIGRALADQEVVRGLLAQLEPQERDVLLARQGFAQSDGRLTQGDPATLDQVGERLGVPKHRVRDLERRALVKLRALAPAVS